PAVPTRGVTNDTITVGGLGYGAFYADSAVGAQARFDKANSSNEIPGGRKINFLGFRDDGSDQNKDLDEGRKLVQDDQIFAAVPVITPFLGASDFFAQNKTPFIGWGISSGFCDNPFGFGFTGCLTPENPKSAASTWGEMMKKTFNGDTKGKTAAVISRFDAFESAQQGTTAMQQIIDEIHAVKPDQMLTQPVLAGYLSADLFVNMLKKTGKNLTAERFLRVANKNFKYELQNVTGPITFPSAHKVGSPCGTLVETDGSNYSVRVPFACYKLVKVS